MRKTEGWRNHTSCIQRTRLRRLLPTFASVRGTSEGLDRLQRAFDEKQTIAGVVAEQVKGGFEIDIGVRAFMPASRSGVREVDEMPNLIGQEIQCRITKLDTEKEDVVVDRRIVLEQEQARRKEEAFSSLHEGAVVEGRVRNVMEFGAFVDIGGVDGLLHVVDMSWNRVSKPSHVIKPGDQLTVKILKVDPANKKISLGLKQLQDDPWTVAVRTFNQGDRVSGTVSRLTDFGAFVELLPGVDGLIHLSEMSWDKRVRKPSDVVKVGERVDVVVLQVNPAEKRIALGLKNVWATLGKHCRRSIPSARRSKEKSPIWRRSERSSIWARVSRG